MRAVQGGQGRDSAVLGNDDDLVTQDIDPLLAYPDVEFLLVDLVVQGDEFTLQAPQRRRRQRAAPPSAVLEPQISTGRA